jgi:hypothetical protein
MQGAVDVVWERSFEVVGRSAVSRFLHSPVLGSFPGRSWMRLPIWWAPGRLASPEHPAALKALGAAGG